MLLYGSFRVGKQGNRYREVKKDSFLNEFFGDSDLWGYLTQAMFPWAGHLQLTFQSLPSGNPPQILLEGMASFLQISLLGNVDSSVLFSPGPQTNTPFLWLQDRVKLTYDFFWMNQVPVPLYLTLHVKFSKWLSDSTPLFPGGAGRGRPNTEFQRNSHYRPEDQSPGLQLIYPEAKRWLNQSLHNVVSG